MKNLLALNWKMNKTPTEARAWAQELGEKLEAGQAELAVMAPAITLSALAANLPTGVGFGGQDVSAHESGAYTGEISAAMLKDVGATYAVVGHSERRDYHGETDAVVAAKARQAQANGLTPIVCVGEKLDVREAGEHVPFTLAQLAGSLEGVGTDVVVAYEPVWAIGTGKTATAEDAEELAAAIRSALEERYGDAAAGIRVLYGGSVKPDNIASICAKPNVNGALVGGASLKVADVLGMNDALK
ncbi:MULTISPECIES: triose-phosphate isomerase [Deinococcus]|uniref:Triosephosphate isomerase n=2 Tax=Deinococcus soli (ex Cha et al. 2016) TaxID=1309411 RepID=A0A0F7JIL8_9DEIO|nr:MULTISPECIES: triose-phosphate isomerase [Deinococcus]AKH15871.1 triosephosphate isomerase [Deinococcus soli (ex Cha et al. 2016)]MDK2011159.1 triose-phosphate isomerase [Deinococcus sp. 43]MDR6217338.1 triosephosphate isomerase [Deinococcus soli (ex Cha et al. 2016)]MDR6326647.1 triosephosphate isomerase [Deinococcus soli (ex Cha et al. 2016)]MDR6750626.1 triosephosphate isomerase [Deinococcus soli (ex Cha et al. 2016)]